MITVAFIFSILFGVPPFRQPQYLWFSSTSLYFLPWSGPRGPWWDKMMDDNSNEFASMSGYWMHWMLVIILSFVHKYKWQVWCSYIFPRVPFPRPHVCHMFVLSNVSETPWMTGERVHWWAADELHMWYLVSKKSMRERVYYRFPMFGCFHKTRISPIKHRKFRTKKSFSQAWFVIVWLFFLSFIRLLL